MTDPTSKKLSRRDAIKILGAAAGASVLANLPSKWTSPELTSGVLPAHAQTSNPAPYTLMAGADEPDANFCQPFPFIIGTVTISPPAQNISLRYLITTGLTIFSSALLTDIVLTDPAGSASLPLDVDGNSAFGSVTITWSFVNASDGTNTDAQVFTSLNSGC